MRGIFVNRERELGWLRSKLSSESSELLILYGRRRVGKSALVLKAIEGLQRAIYFQHTLKSLKLQIEELQEKAGKVMNDPLLLKKPFSSLEDLLIYLSRWDETVLVLDEFPYLVNASPEIPSVIQRVWDQELSSKNFKLILVGSLMSTMERLIRYTGPLYGRKTGSWKLSPLSFIAFWEYLSKLKVNLSPREALEYWAVLGGTPYYWNFFSFESLFNELLEKIIRKGAPLHEEPLFLLREELREPIEYFSILQVLASGPRPIGKIASELSESSQKLSKYLKVLQELELVKVEYPVSLKEKRKRRGLYKVTDYLLRFWFRYLLPNMHYTEMGEEKQVLEKIKLTWHDFLGKAYEELALDLLLRRVREREEVRAWGRWWDEESELDGVVITKNTLYICEAKLSREVDLQKMKKASFKLLEQLRKEGFEPKRVRLWAFNASEDFWGREIETMREI